jgi:NADH dehydrogenase
MKTIDDALEVRGRIFGVFELAELEDDPTRRAACLQIFARPALAASVRAGELDE